jgi:pyruvate/2-oxoglutarate dehydrogenase complex dihydrolipoamide dehydrogenase (E3) component
LGVPASGNQQDLETDPALLVGELLVVGGGVWGTWTALLAKKLGASVTLMEASVPGHRDANVTQACCCVARRANTGP